MNKVYFGITRDATKPTSIVGIVANLQLAGSRAATEEEVGHILSQIKDSATGSLADALRDGTYPNVISVWDKRADARAAIQTLKSYSSPHFIYGVGEFGDAERTVTKPKGWRLMSEDDISCYNSLEDGATIPLDGDGANHSWDNLLFPTREAARKVIREGGLGTDLYSVVRVDA